MEEFDFYISSNGRLVIPKYDINYLIDMANSILPSMPETIDNTVQIAGKDGDVSLSTSYQALSFNIICYTEDGLEPKEKIKEENKINMFLNEMKDKNKTFALEQNEKFYEVKYSGALTTTRYPMHIEFSIPLKASNPYGISFKKKEIIGNGELNSDTIKDCGAVFTINGPATSPIISLNDYSMEFSTSIVDGAILVIDTNKSTVTYTNPNGLKTNQMKYYNHQFPKIKYGNNVLKVLSGIDDPSQVKVEWRDLML